MVWVRGGCLFAAWLELMIGVRVGLVGVGVRAGCLFAVLFRVGD